MAAIGLAIFVVMFLVVFVARTLVQKRRTGDTGIRSGVLDESFGSIEWLAGWLLVVALLSGVVAPVAEMGGIDPWFTSQWVRGTGAVVAAVGVGLTVVSQLAMGDAWRIGVDADEETGLVTGGAFAVVRNPVFGCMIVTGVGLAILVPNLISAVGLILVVVAIELQVRFVEEPYLRGLHGDIYAVYVARVGRLFPGVGRG
jgi:protein-S-isoprenylcysteine O-methyltransferase Ste14